MNSRFIVTMLVLFFVTLGVHAQTTRISDPFGSGVGIGPVYGGFGANLEYRIMPNYSATAAIGLDGEKQWLLGGRYYLGEETRKTRGRLTLGFGEFEENNDLFSHRGQKHRVLLGIGWTNANANNKYHGWAVDLTTEGTINVGYMF